MNIRIIYPSREHSGYKIACDIFSQMAKKVAGVESNICTDENIDKSMKYDLTVLIGSDAVNNVTASLYLSMKTESFAIRYSTDDYCIRSVNDSEDNYLILAGGRARSTIYAVYRYFELFCGCRWFWDGDRIEESELLYTGIDITESPRFEYRGLRYFAHRSLHRFQAEHWDLDDWKNEIDWILKKRLNLFMLRIGMDDLFQKAFPDIVDYPELEKPLPEATVGFDDRSLFWSLQHRGELRKKILRYAFERDLMHPEDCGTMTHWYSRTPIQFLDKIKPKFLPQTTNIYNDPTGRVWDIRDKNNFENYMHLTETHINEYGKSELFHTIGLGERLYSNDPEENKRMKLFVYHKLSHALKEKYPNSPLLIASWDLWMHFSPEEVRELVSEFDPSQVILFDYTSDTMRENNFTTWGVLDRFPWVFGIFSGYEQNSEIRGYYELTNERLKLAKSDKMCKGLIFWPELSHGDPFALHYFTTNAWDSTVLSINEHIEKYCADRYPSDISKKMVDIWECFMPIVSLTSWSIDDTNAQNGLDIFPSIVKFAKFDKKEKNRYFEDFSKINAWKKNAINILGELSSFPLYDELVKRDIFDILRTILGRFINCSILNLEIAYANECDIDEFERKAEIARGLLRQLSALLGSHDDFSLLFTLERLKAAAETNPNFEATLKRNAECDYCRSYIFENCEYLYIPEMNRLFDEVKKSIITGKDIDEVLLKNEILRIKDEFYSTPLNEMRRVSSSISDIADVSARFISMIE